MTRLYSRKGVRENVVDLTDNAGYDGWPVSFYKSGTAPEAAGRFYSWAKDAGYPGAWAPGTPGLAGRVTDGTAVADRGCLPYKNATTGSNYLASFQATASVACQLMLVDVLWVNSGIVVTTVGAQLFSSVTWPARDKNGSTDGEDVQIGILVTTTTTNAGAITNTTLSYTNSDNTGGARTATITAVGGFPATGVIGTLVPFELAAGDIGVRSIQSITLGTSYGGGAISLIAYREIARASCLLANVGSAGTSFVPPGMKLYNGSCLLPVGLMSATTATVISGTASIVER
jgi:hypothetical protein